MKNLVLLAASCVISLTLAELLLRVAYVAPAQEQMDFFRISRSEYYQRDAKLGWRPRPNVSGRHPRPDGHLAMFSTNELGLRGPPIVELNSHSHRVLVLGDSFAWGYRVDDGKIFSDRLRELADAFEVVNLGVTGFGIRQHRIHYEIVGRKLSANIAVIAVCQNDIAEAAKDFLARPEVPQQKRKRSWKSFASENLALYRLLADVVNSSRTIRSTAVRLGLKEQPDGFSELDVNLRPFLRNAPPEQDEAWAAFRADLEDLVEVLHADGLDVLVMAIPALQTVDFKALRASLTYSEYGEEDFDLDSSYQRLALLADELQVRYVNPTQQFRQVAGQGERLYLERDMHFNEAGHELFAEALYMELIELVQLRR